MGPRILVVASKAGYQTRVFAEAGERLGYEVVLATDRCHVLEDPWGDRAIPLRFDTPEEGLEAIAALQPLPSGVVALGDKPAYVASLVAKHLNLSHNDPMAVRACQNKYEARELFRGAGLRVPKYKLVPLSGDAAPHRYPCVLKPLGLSASRGVIRADTGAEFQAAFARIRALLETAELRNEQRFIQIEDYIQGSEYAVEGMLIEGQLKVLAIFDKPDPLDGPFFEETIYVTPSRAPAEVQAALVEATEKAVAALGLTRGPIHAELRSNETGAWILEVAARSIGGLCARSLRFNNGVTLEEIILRHAAGDNVSALERETAASGVMMIPVPANGIYQGVGGVDKARAVAHIEDVVITAKEGQRLMQLPEGNSYPGFIFARAEDPSTVEQALRLAHRKLEFEIMPEIARVRPGA